MCGLIIGRRGEDTAPIISAIHKLLRRTSGRRSNGSYESQIVPADDSLQRAFTGHLDIYYDAVIASIRNAELILLFGPSEPKSELNTHLERAGLGGRIVGVETADKTMDRQIAAKVRTHFTE